RELGRSRLDGQGQRESARREDLTDERDRAKVRAREDDPLAQAVRAREPVPSLKLDRGQERAIDARDREDLEVLEHLIHEDPPDQIAPIGGDQPKYLHDDSSRPW